MTAENDAVASTLFTVVVETTDVGNGYVEYRFHPHTFTITCPVHGDVSTTATTSGDMLHPDGTVSTYVHLVCVECRAVEGHASRPE